ncbi:MAG TPA: MarR family transcriptional regulator [Acidimicrobiia bacterium]|nr:MarR family transcriptional regulator [Acidimicrobiia bacterium]
MTPARLTDQRLLVLHSLRLRGFVDRDSVAQRTGVDAATVAHILEQACADGHVVERSGRISGWILTPDGRAAHAGLLAEELAERGCRSDVELGNEAFLALNEPFKQICTRWQLRPDGSPNDHGDAAYDAAVVADLEGLHPQAVAVTAGLAEFLPRFGMYEGGFSAALARLRNGDTRALAAPLAASYHDHWMELHQDLLSTLGRERSTADGH